MLPPNTVLTDATTCQESLHQWDEASSHTTLNAPNFVLWNQPSSTVESLSIGVSIEAHERDMAEQPTIAIMRSLACQKTTFEELHQ